MDGIVGAGLAPALVAIKNKSWSGAAILMTFSLFQKAVVNIIWLGIILDLKRY